MARHTPEQLDKMPKLQLAQMHVDNGGLMGLPTYRKWSKDELVNAVLQDEALMALESDSQ